jgi:hypothetical protein
MHQVPRETCRSCTHAGRRNGSNSHFESLETCYTRAGFSLPKAATLIWKNSWRSFTPSGTAIAEVNDGRTEIT